MGPMKDALFLEIFRHLRYQPDRRILLSTLNAPTSGLHAVRNAWQELQNNGREEGMSKAKKLKHILAERSDLFMLVNLPSGHPAVSLSPAATQCDAGSGLPPRELIAALAVQFPQPGDVCPPDFGTGEVSVESAAAAVTALENAIAAISGGSTSVNPGASSSSAAANAASTQIASSSAAAPAAPTGVLMTQLPAVLPVDATDAAATLAAMAGLTRGGDDLQAGVSAKRKKSTSSSSSYFAAAANAAARGHTNDLIWTPLLAAVQSRDEQKEKDMCRAMVEAVESYKGSEVSVSMVGFDCRVSTLRKEPTFKNDKLQDILKRHEDIFELVPDTRGSLSVKILPDAQNLLYEHHELEHKLQAQAMLPEKLENPYNIKERIQALRIECIHALHRRSGQCAIQELGQEPGVQRHKQSIFQAKKLQDFVQLFPNNFAFQRSELGSMVVLASYDVTDQSMIQASIDRSNAEHNNRYGQQRPGGQRPPHSGNRGFTGPGSANHTPLQTHPFTSGGFSNGPSAGYGPLSNTGFSGGGFSSMPPVLR